MCFGNDSPPPAPYIPPPPPEPEFMDVIDEITGTQSIVVTGPDGKKRRVNSRLPRSPEEEARFKAAEELFSSSMKNMVQLYQYNPESMVDFSPIINTFANIDQQRMKELGEVANIGNIAEDIAQFKEIQNNLLDEEFNIQNRETESNLARRGLGTSTYATEVRAANASKQKLARLQAGMMASEYGENLASKRLARNKEAFGLNEMGREGQLKSAMGQYAMLKEHEADIERRRQQAIAENKGYMDVSSGVIGADLSKAMANSNTADSLNTFNSQAGASMNRYNADVNRIAANHRMEMDAYNSQPPSFLETAMNIGGRLGGAALGGGLFGASNSSRVGMDTVGVPFFSRGGRR